MVHIAGTFSLDDVFYTLLRFLLSLYRYFYGNVVVPITSESLQGEFEFESPASHFLIAFLTATVHRITNDSIIYLGSNASRFVCLRLKLNQKGRFSICGH